MRLVISTEAHFSRGVDGVLRSGTGGRAYPFWSRYLDVFDQIVVVARVTDRPAADGYRVEGEGVTVHPVGSFSGVRRTLQALPRIRRTSVELAEWPDTAYLARVPSVIGSSLIRELRSRGVPYGLEVIGDPEASARSGVGGRLAPLYALSARRRLRAQCQHAAGVAYVTSNYLQNRYPSGPNALVAEYSSVDLPDAAFTASPRRITDLTRARLVSVGTQSQRYKGHDVLMNATSTLVSQGVAVHLTLVGGGRHHEELIGLSRALGLHERVTFTGEIPSGAPVRKLLDESDIFVLPSLTEGLPRALIEAMARGVPCIASAVGGIPELLDSCDLVAPGDPDALANSLATVIRDPQRRERMSQRNWARALEFHESELQVRRDRFYRALASCYPKPDEETHV